MAYTKDQVAATMDHATLKPNMTDEQIRENAKMCADNKVKSLCVRPSDAPLAAKELQGTDTIVSMVVGFPHGANMPETKALETKLGLEAGVKEFDMVMNIGKLISGDYEWVKRDIEAVVAEAKKDPEAIVKVIFETCYLTDDQIKKACEIVLETDADFVKTSTGFGEDDKQDKSSNPHVVGIMMEMVKGKKLVKPSGGIRDWKTATMFLDMGVDRLGVGSAKQILAGSPEGCGCNCACGGEKKDDGGY